MVQTFAFGNIPDITQQYNTKLLTKKEENEHCNRLLVFVVERILINLRNRARPLNFRSLNFFLRRSFFVFFFILAIYIELKNCLGGKAPFWLVYLLSNELIYLIYSDILYKKVHFSKCLKIAQMYLVTTSLGRFRVTDRRHQLFSLYSFLKSFSKETTSLIQRVQYPLNEGCI